MYDEIISEKTFKSRPGQVKKVVPGDFPKTQCYILTPSQAIFFKYDSVGVKNVNAERILLGTTDSSRRFIIEPPYTLTQVSGNTKTLTAAITFEEKKYSLQFEVSKIPDDTVAVYRIKVEKSKRIYINGDKENFVDCKEVKIIDGNYLITDEQWKEVKLAFNYDEFRKRKENVDKIEGVRVKD